MWDFTAIEIYMQSVNYYAKSGKQRISSSKYNGSHEYDTFIVGGFTSTSWSDNSRILQV